MTEIINEINSFINNKYAGYLLKNYGFCELMKKTSTNSEQPMPVTIPDRLQVSIDDNYQIITWIRWIDDTSYETDDEWSFGTRIEKKGTIPLRIVFANKVELGENMVFDFAKSFPQRIQLSGYKYIFSDGIPRINPDHETIYTTELGNTVYERHRFPWNIYVVDVSIEFIECAPISLTVDTTDITVDSSLITVDAITI